MIAIGLFVIVFFTIVGEALGGNAFAAILAIVIVLFIAIVGMGGCQPRHRFGALDAPPDAGRVAALDGEGDGPRPVAAVRDGVRG